ncbi:S1 family peptidase [Pimelobacter simplex]|uniref:S1 family peptidase n=1 Tax=Nocardioides simplex TaxID=2045 RepID=UPI0021505155|nr:S1 family peptidase [Pimelobacter simplex]UUW89048.1 S1 family peptidase [Pimelobacter simplex]UUW98552.1 S1 family peptidase [Pimelobacter simplex]
MRTRSRFAGLVAAALLPVTAAAILSTPSARADDPDRPPDASVSDVPVRSAPPLVSIDTGRHERARGAVLSEAARQDLRTVAETQGVPYDELAARSAGTDEFDLALHEAEVRYPRAVLESGVEPTGGYWVEAGADADLAAVAEVFGAVPAPVTVHRRVDATDEEITRAQELVFLALADAPVTTGVGVDYDAHRGVLEVDVAVPDVMLRAAAETVAVQALRSVAGLAVDGRLPVPVELTTRVGVDDGTLKGKRGGRALRLASNGTFVCTGGFVVRRGGDVGIVTARHCPNGLTYNSNPILTFVTGASTTATGGVIDLQFHRFDPGIDVDPSFRASGTTSADDRPVRTVANAPVGSSVCAWGAAGGYHCTSVAEVNVCRNGFGDGVNRCGLDRASSEITVAGDSGGPWFFSNTARGTLTGAINGRDYFTRIGRVANNLDAEVLRP